MRCPQLFKMVGKKLYKIESPHEEEKMFDGVVAFEGDSFVKVTTVQISQESGNPKSKIILAEVLRDEAVVKSIEIDLKDYVN
jgi:hypothetical protein